MKLVKAELNESYPMFHLVSENGVWEMGARPMLSGVRVNVGKVGEQCYTIDYCAGADQSFIWQLLITVHQILSLLSETITPREMVKMFPTYQVRPIDKDPCWEKLQELLKELEANA